MTDTRAPDMLASLQADLAAQAQVIADLERARDAAVAANQAKSRYLVGVSHEIRSPLNAIYGYAQLLERDAGVPPAEAARVIRRSAEHLTNLVNGLLDISRIESGVLKLSRDLVPFPALLDQLVEMFRMQAEAKGLEFRYTTEGRIPACVRTDEKRLRQILINLLSNAVKYTESGHAAIHVRYRSQTVDVEISDTGIGIAPEHQERIFEPFNRGAINDRHAQPGTGLGLAITRVLVQIMGGEITLRSAPGEGSTFRVRLLLPEPVEAPPPTARRRNIAGYAGPRRSVLLVDDDPAQLAVLHTLLAPLGFTVHAAATGAQGIALAEAYRPDIALLDIHLPDMRGWQVADALRARLGARSRILMVSANAHEFAAGGDGGSAHDGFLMKPVELEALLDALAAQLRLDWITAAAPAPPAPGPPPPPAAIDTPGDAEPFLAELRQLGRIGHVRAIGGKLDELERAVPGAAPLVARLRQHADGFDLKAYLRILDGHSHGE